MSSADKKDVSSSNNSTTSVISTTTLRPLQCELSTLGNATGSALWRSGATTVLAAVQGPSAPRQPQLEDSTSGIVSVIIKALTDTTSSTEQLTEWQVFLSNTLSACVCTTSFPRSVVSIILQVQSADGSVLAACLHAAVAALMDAGIEMICLPVAVTCLLQTSQTSNSNSTTTTTKIDISLDPTLAQEQRDETGLLCIVVSSSSSSSSASKNNSNNTILGCYSAGLKIHAPTLLQCCGLAERAAPAIVAFWRLAVEQKTRREYQTLLAAATAHPSN